MELIDVGVDKYAVNIIIDNIIEQVDDQVWGSIILEEIVSFCRDMDGSIPIEEHSYTNVKGIQRPVITTKGWGVQVKWIYQCTDWVPLHLIKE